MAPSPQTAGMMSRGATWLAMNQSPHAALRAEGRLSHLTLEETLSTAPWGA